MSSKDIIKECIKYGDFTLKSGKKSSYYVDLRPLISSPDKIRLLCIDLLNHIEKRENIKICGLPYAGIPYACALSILYNIPFVMLRKEQKKHGIKRMVEGVYAEGDELVIIDDILTTGSSVIESLKYLNDFKIQKVIVILDREEGGREELEKLGLKVESLFKISDLNL
jgi:uridine monophosphate synthetase